MTLQLDQVSLHFGDRVLFDDVSLNLISRYRYVIVGANGCGKSSLLSLIADVRHARRDPHAEIG